MLCYGYVCYITCVMLCLLDNICVLCLLYNICDVMLYNMSCHVI